jgi:hypothetical protein
MADQPIVLSPSIVVARTPDREDVANPADTTAIGLPNSADIGHPHSLLSEEVAPELVDRSASYTTAINRGENDLPVHHDATSSGETSIIARAPIVAQPSTPPTSGVVACHTNPPLSPSVAGRTPVSPRHFKEPIPSLDPATYRCRQPQHHARPGHSIFISYRVATERDFAQRLVDILERHPHVLANGYSVFLDKKCLAIGEPWQEGFCQGLRGSDVVVVLVSNDGLRKCTEAHERADNYLLEIEQALLMRTEKVAQVCPILLRKSTADEDRIDYSVLQYAVQEAFHPWARRSVRDTLKELLDLQGNLIIQTDEAALHKAVEDVLDKHGTCEERVMTGEVCVCVRLYVYVREKEGWYTLI